MTELKLTTKTDCPYCDGSGIVFFDTTNDCNVVRGECCGGCGRDIPCDDCNGTGEIEQDEE